MKTISVPLMTIRGVSTSIKFPVKAISSVRFEYDTKKSTFPAQRAEGWELKKIKELVKKFISSGPKGQLSFFMGPYNQPGSVEITKEIAGISGYRIRLKG